MAADKTQLIQLMALRKKNLKPWFIGKIPHHYKRISVDAEEMMRLALQGYSEINTMFGDKTYFTQSVIAGAILSKKYYRIIVCCPSQMGKSWLLGRASVILAHNGDPNFVAGGRKNTTEIIMGHMLSSLQYMPEDVQRELLESKDQIGRAHV